MSARNDRMPPDDDERAKGRPWLIDALPAVIVATVTLLAISQTAAQEPEDDIRELEAVMGCPGFDEEFRELMSELLSTRAPRNVELDWDGRFGDDGRAVVDTITINGRVYRVDHDVATCTELTAYLLSFLERDLDAHPPVSFAFFVSLYPDVGSTTALTAGGRVGLQLVVDRFALIVHADVDLPQSGPISAGSDAILRSSNLRGGLLACGRPLTRTPTQALSLDACGGFSAGAALATFNDGSGTELAALFALSVAVVLRVPIVDRFDFITAAELDVFIVRPAVAAPPPDFRSIPASEVVAGRLHLGVAVRL